MRLSKRIYAICDAVSMGETVADIGTDHGYVPMLLMKNNISPYAIMADISEGSLAKAIETFNQADIPADDSQFRLGDGLECIRAGEVDDIIIAGLGGYTIIDILKYDIEKSKSFSKLILQPRKYSGNLRFFLYTHGWDIVREQLAPEGKFVCEIITAVPSDCDSREEPYPENDIRWKYPVEMALADPELFRKRLEWKYSSIDEEIINLKNSKSANSEKINELKADRLYLQELENSVM